MSRSKVLTSTEGKFIRKMESLISKIFYGKKKMLRKNPKAWLQGKKCCYLRKGLITKNTSVKYESSSIHSSKVICKVNVFKKWVKLRRSRSHGKKIIELERSYHKVHSCEIPKA